MLVMWICLHYGSMFATIGLVFISFVATILLGGSGYMLASALRNQHHGPFFIYTLSDQQISLPRIGFNGCFRDVVGWRLVSGNWTGPIDSQKKSDFPMSELQLIVNTSNDTIAYAVAGAKATCADEPARMSLCR